MMEACPKCDAPLVGAEAECPRCGVVIAKALAAARKAPPAAPPEPPSPSLPGPRPSGVSEGTLRLLQGTANWVHGIAAFVLLAGALMVVGAVLLLFQVVRAVDAPEKFAAGLAVMLLTLTVTIGCVGVGLRLAGFASALSPRRRRLQEADLASVVDTHRRLWVWILRAYLAYILAVSVAWSLLSS